MIKSKCEKCGVDFEQSGKDSSGKHYIKRFCSRSCANGKQWTDADKKKKSESAKKSDLVAKANSVTLAEDGQYYRLGKPIVSCAAKNRSVKRKCPICGEEFHTKKKTQTYCSKFCCDEDARQGYKHRQKPKSGGYRLGGGISKTGWYKGFFCGSTYELVYLIWNLDSGNFIDRCSLVFEYDYNGSVHKYYPDFQTDSGIVEIKGYHTDLVDIKAQAVVDAGYDIKVLYKQDLKHCFEYVSTKYGTNKFETLYENNAGLV